MVSFTVLVVVLFLVGRAISKALAKKQPKPLSTCAVRKDSSVRYTHQALPPMVSEEELVKLETPSFLRVRKAANKNLQAVHSGKASCLTELEQLVVAPPVEAQQVLPAGEGKSRRKSRHKKQVQIVAVQEVSVGGEASLLLPDPAAKIF